MKLEQTIYYGSKEAVIQNLEDAGCSQPAIDAFLACKSPDGQLKLLEQHRQQLLRNVHNTETQISCLDYLVYQIRRNCDENHRTPNP